MLDIKFIRENKEVVQAGAQKKGIDINLDELIAADDKRRQLLTEIEAKKAEQNQFSGKIVNASETDKVKLIEEMKVLKEGLSAEEEKLKEVMKDWQRLMVQVPNVPDMSVPEGKDETENKEIKTSGEKPKFDFTPKSHIELMEKMEMLDLDRGTKVAGFRGYFLKNDGVLLNFAIWQFVLETMTGNGEFTPLLSPSLVRKETLLGTGYLPQGEEDLYRTQDDSYLAGTSEVPTMSYYSDEIIEKKKLPVKFLAFSPCFRREAGSHGKDTKGLIRVHEFYKFEQVIICEANHEESVKHHEELTLNAEKILQALKLPYRNLLICGGDLGLGQVKKYDLEAWMPSENTYRETHSASYFHDFQTRRLNIRYRDDEGKLRFAHSLNNTALATPRIIAAIVENYQNADGTINIPEALQKYMGGRKVIEPKK
ncbi:MAG TPA: serine--tRNA ligase [Candidatus Paceibacterota bacterium]|nr:serine--tRNA ligase [Candidatus Paceibacterota bacterium]